MVARGPDDVGCAHCTKLGARQACQVCTRMVCDACAIDWTTCADPAGREIRLGMSARVRDVDAAGRFALVTHALRSPRVLDLRTFTWLHSDVAVSGRAPARLTSDGFVVHTIATLYADGNPTMWGVRWQSVLDHAIVADVDIEAAVRLTCTSAHEERYAYVTGSEQVIVMKHEVAHHRVSVTWRKFDPLPRKVIHALALDRDILVTGTWREISIDRIVDDKLEHLAHHDTGLDGNIEWIELAGSHLVYEAAGRVQVRRLDADYKPVPKNYWRLDGVVTRAALSVDGRYLALAYDKRLIMRDLETNEEIEFSEHTDTISFLRFTHDHMLISADDDNRLILRPRGARAVISVKLSET